MWDDPEFDGHERVLFAHDAATGLRAVVAIHSRALGPAFGGCRMRAYADDAAALTDALRLSRGMTYKAAICGLPLGGGKSVILGDPRRDKTPDLLRAMGRLVESLGGRYVVADDVGTTLDDLAVMREETRHTAAATLASRESTLGVTAHGVLAAIRAAARHRLGLADLAGLRVAVQGLGNVGMPLCGYLAAEGASLVVADPDPARVAQAATAHGARVVPPEAVYDAGVDLFAPCALGGVLDDAAIPRLKARVVCGGANNQLAARHHDSALAARGIAYIPDYVANAGGVIDYYQETIDDRPEAVLHAVGRIEAITAGILEQAAASGRTPLQVADAMVAERLATARAG